MNVLGISYSMHESAACLVQQGRVVFACAEERLSRQKQDASFPVRAIRTALHFADLRISDIDHVAVSWPRPHVARWHDVKLMMRGQIPLSAQRLERFGASLAKGYRHAGGRTQFVRAFPEARAPWHYINHHLAHALSAYAISDFEDSGILVVDGRGASEATTLWHAKGDKLQLLETHDFPNSIGVFYAGITEMLGFQPLSDEWKVMGLAAYGKPSIDLTPLLQVHEESYRVTTRRFYGRVEGDRSGLEEVVGRRRIEEEITPGHENLARSAQNACEAAMLAMLRRLHRLTGSRNLCLAGGVALNSKANGELLRSGLIDRICIQPAAGDDGACIGAAYAVYDALGIPLPRRPLGHSYLGNEFTSEEIETALRIYKLPFRAVENPSRSAAELLANNRIVGWFQGRAEFGPRALGNRSILADPRFAENRDRVNDAVKFRENWRPFAPSVLHERGAEYFEDYTLSPYMILTFWTREEKKAEIPAVVHVDGSARVQSVQREFNPKYYDLVAEFGRLTGTPLVLNTSFNLKGDPIVGSPKDAVQTFYTSGLDDLVIGDYIVSKSPR